jgi:hypothetical protein
MNTNRITLRLYNGYWTIFSGNQPIMACVSLASALEYLT